MDPYLAVYTHRMSNFPTEVPGGHEISYIHSGITYAVLLGSANCTKPCISKQGVQCQISPIAKISA